MAATPQSGARSSNMTRTTPSQSGYVCIRYAEVGLVRDGVRGQKELTKQRQRKATVLYSMTWGHVRILQWALLHVPRLWGPCLKCFSGLHQRPRIRVVVQHIYNQNTRIIIPVVPMFMEKVWKFRTWHNLILVVLAWKRLKFGGDSSSINGICLYPKPRLLQCVSR